MPEYDEFADLYRLGMSMDEVLAAMKERGLTMIQAIAASRRLFGVALGEAKTIVASHPSWAEAAAVSALLHDELIKLFEDSDDPQSPQSLHR